VTQATIADVLATPQASRLTFSWATTKGDRGSLERSERDSRRTSATKCSHRYARHIVMPQQR
jgi:hypothetical protein